MALPGQVLRVSVAAIAKNSAFMTHIAWKCFFAYNGMSWNLIKIVPESYDLLDSDLKKDGYGNRQHLDV